MAAVNPEPLDYASPPHRAKPLPFSTWLFALLYLITTLLVAVAINVLNIWMPLR